MSDAYRLMAVSYRCFFQIILIATVNIRTVSYRCFFQIILIVTVNTRTYLIAIISTGRAK